MTLQNKCTLQYKLHKISSTLFGMACCTAKEYGHEYGDKNDIRRSSPSKENTVGKTTKDIPLNRGSATTARGRFKPEELAKHKYWAVGNKFMMTVTHSLVCNPKISL